MEEARVPVIDSAVRNMLPTLNRPDDVLKQWTGCYARVHCFTQNLNLEEKLGKK